MTERDADRAGSTSPGRGFWERGRWLGVALWLLLLIGIDMTSRTIGLRERESVYLIVAALASVAVVAIVAFARLANSPPELRTLRFIAVLLPSVFILSIQVVLYFLETDEAVTEAGEHVFATAILSAGAIPFSVYIFRSFSRLRDELARRAQHLQSLHQTSMDLTGQTVLPRLYASVTDGVRNVVAADSAALVMASDGSEGRAVQVAPVGASISHADEARLREVARTGRLAEGHDADGAFLAVPIRRQGEVVGAMAAMRHGEPYPVEDELLLGMFSVAVSVALDNVSRLEEAQLLAMIDERERIARDLHDDLGQLLGFLTTKIQATHELIASGRVEPAQAELARLEEATRTLGAQVREAILGLRARIGPDRPLCRTLEDYVTEFGVQAGLSAEFTSTPDAGAGLPGSVQFQLLRIAQEALSNARRHANATHVGVRLAESDGHLDMSIRDDGEGFEPEAATSGGGFGLKTMEERVRTLSGTFRITSSPGEGTEVSVRTPLWGD